MKLFKTEDLNVPAVVFLVAMAVMAVLMIVMTN
jgi:hypothetical protein